LSMGNKRREERDEGRVKAAEGLTHAGPVELRDGVAHVARTRVTHMSALVLFTCVRCQADRTGSVSGRHGPIF
jgi:hypothetical protein